MVLKKAIARESEIVDVADVVASRDLQLAHARRTHEHNMSHLSVRPGYDDVAKPNNEQPTPPPPAVTRVISNTADIDDEAAAPSPSPTRDRRRRRAITAQDLTQTGESSGALLPLATAVALCAFAGGLAVGYFALSSSVRRRHEHV